MTTQDISMSLIIRIAAVSTTLEVFAAGGLCCYDDVIGRNTTTTLLLALPLVEFQFQGETVKSEITS